MINSCTFLVIVGYDFQGHLISFLELPAISSSAVDEKNMTQEFTSSSYIASTMNMTQMFTSSSSDADHEKNTSILQKNVSVLEACLFDESCTYV